MIQKIVVMYLIVLPSVQFKCHSFHHLHLKFLLRIIYQEYPYVISSSIHYFKVLYSHFLDGVFHILPPKVGSVLMIN